MKGEHSVLLLSAAFAIACLLVIAIVMGMAVVLDPVP